MISGSPSDDCGASSARTGRNSRPLCERRTGNGFVRSSERRARAAKPK
jgi:hypothetical protein